MSIRDGSRKTFLTLKGSLHKNRFGGTNYERFPARLLAEEIQWLESHLLLPAAALEIHGLEFGVNLPVAFDVSDFIERQALLFGTGEMIPYRPANGLSLGRYCPGAEKALKLYDKGLQNSLPFPLMRYELRFHKMRELKALGIRYLSDLLNPSLYPALLEMLLQCWDKLLIGKPFRPEELRSFPPKDADLFGKGYCRDFWRELRTSEGSDAFTNKRKKYRALLERQGIFIQQELRAQIRQEWELLTTHPAKETAGAPTDFYGKSPTVTDVGNSLSNRPGNAVLRKIPIKINGEFPLIPLSAEKSEEPEKMFQNVSKPPPPARRCLSCGKDISGQTAKSVFCSAKNVGEQAAHRCRNAFHNRQRDMRAREINYRTGILFDASELLLMPEQRLTNGGYSYRARKVFSPLPETAQ